MKKPVTGDGLINKGNAPDNAKFVREIMDGSRWDFFNHGGIQERKKSFTETSP